MVIMIDSMRAGLLKTSVLSNVPILLHTTTAAHPGLDNVAWFLCPQMMQLDLQMADKVLLQGNDTLLQSTTYVSRSPLTCIIGHLLLIGICCEQRYQMLRCQLQLSKLKECLALTRIISA